MQPICPIVGLEPSGAIEETGQIIVNWASQYSSRACEADKARKDVTIKLTADQWGTLGGQLCIMFVLT